MLDDGLCLWPQYSSPTGWRGGVDVDGFAQCPADDPHVAQAFPVYDYALHVNLTYFHQIRYKRLFITNYIIIWFLFHNYSAL